MFFMPLGGLLEYMRDIQHGALAPAWADNLETYGQFTVAEPAGDAHGREAIVITEECIIGSNRLWSPGPGFLNTWGDICSSRQEQNVDILKQGLRNCFAVLFYILEIQGRKCERSINVLCGIPQSMKRIDGLQKSCPHFIRCIKILHNANDWLFGDGKGLTVISFQWALTHCGICKYIQQNGGIFSRAAQDSGMTKQENKIVSRLSLQDALRTEQSIGCFKARDTTTGSR